MSPAYTKKLAEKVLLLSGPCRVAIFGDLVEELSASLREQGAAVESPNLKRATPRTSTAKSSLARTLLNELGTQPSTTTPDLILICLPSRDIGLVNADLARIKFPASTKTIVIAGHRSPGSDAVTAHQPSTLEKPWLQGSFRRHARLFEVSRFEDLDEKTEEVLLAFERIPEMALKRYPLKALATERDLHMDMLREAGSRSDAHLARYQLASKWVRKGDDVLDVACGLGYGSWIIACLTASRSILGLDSSSYAVAYAKENFAKLDARISFEERDAEKLDGIPPSSIDLIVSFETLEHLKTPTAMLKSAFNALRPGGRIILSVPNDWSDESGTDPNPHHHHVYDFARLKAEAEKHFFLEAAYSQIADGCKSVSRGGRYFPASRKLEQVTPTSAAGTDAEWWICVFVKSPKGGEKVPYVESYYPYPHPPKHALAFARDYLNPWLVRSLVEFPTRVSDSKLRSRFAREIISDRRTSRTPDRAAAIAVIGYQLLHEPSTTARELQVIVADIQRYLSNPSPSAHGYRWTISLTYLLALVERRLGNRPTAIKHFSKVASADLSKYSPTLGTKVLSAVVELGWMYLSAGETEKARGCWVKGLETGRSLVKAPWQEYVGETNQPLTFALACLTEIVDCLFQCAKALEWTDPSRKFPNERTWAEARQSWRWMITERWQTIRDLETLIKEKTEALSQSSGRDRAYQEKLLKHIESLEEVARLRFNYLEQASARISSLEDALSHSEDLVRQRDQAIAAQARLIDERWSLLQRAEARNADLEGALASTEALIQERDEAIAAQARLIDERWSLLQRAEARNADLEGALASSEALIQERDQAIAAQARLIDERWSLLQRAEARNADLEGALASSEALIQERDQAIAAQARLIDERWSLLQRAEARNADLEGALASTEALIQERDEAIAAQARLIDERWSLLQRAEARNADLEGALASTEALIQERDEAIAAQARLIDERWSLLQRAEARNADLEGALASSEAHIQERDQAIAAQAKFLEERWRLLTETERRIATLEHRLFDANKSIATVSELNTKLTRDQQVTTAELASTQALLTDCSQKLMTLESTLLVKAARALRIIPAK